MLLQVVAPSGNIRAKRGITWKARAPVLGVLDALVAVEVALSCERLVANMGAARDVAGEGATNVF